MRRRHVLTARAVWLLLSRNPAQSRREIAAALRCSPSAVQRAVEQLAELGYIERGPRLQTRSIRVIVPFYASPKRSS